jgi:DNA-directed RNA polymerase subunit beta'
MLGSVKVTSPGSSNYLIGDVINYQEFCHTNQQIREKNKDKKKGDILQLVQVTPLILNLKQVAKYSSSFLAAISFQDTLKNLVNYSIFQPVDHLHGIKENLLIGQLVPIGSGFEEYQELSRKRKSYQKY